MAEQTFEHLSLEQDIDRLAAEVKGRITGETPEAHKEAIKATLGEQIRVAGGQKPAVATPPSGAPSSAALPNYLQNSDPQTKLQVEKLVDFAWHKGVAAAIKEAKNLGPLYIDALHDALTDKLYEEFKKRKLL